jgi:APA family basic amino acid/polyamine antiporter
MPVSGSSYSYCYATLGEGAAWVLGWLLMLEYGLAASALAAGWSGYFASLLASFGVHAPAALVTPLFDTTPGAASGALHLTHGVNLVAALVIMAVALLLTRGVTEAAWVNTVMVVVKIGVLVIFVAAGLHAIKPANWTPFVPPNQGGFAFGWPGVLRAASILFFAYFGFETVSTAASEARNPEKDMPFGILGSLIACTVIYIVVSLVLTGVAPYRTLGVADPIAVAVDQVGWPALAVVVKLGALTGLSSVLLVNAYGQSRIAFTMAGDGLLPAGLGRLNPVTRTPGAAALWLGAISAVAGALLPIRLLGDLVSFGTALAFSIVGLSVIWLRNVRPELPRPFRVPLGGFRVRGVWIGWIPAAAIAMCWIMMAPVVIDLVRDAFTGNPLPPTLLVIYAAVGAAMYFGFGLRATRRAQP